MPSGLELRSRILKGRLQKIECRSPSRLDFSREFLADDRGSVVLLDYGFASASGERSAANIISRRVNCECNLHTHIHTQFINVRRLSRNGHYHCSTNTFPAVDPGLLQAHTKLHL
jgi:hypothetical protein